MKKIICLFILFGSSISFSLDSQPVIKVYPYYVEPSEYPDFSRRSFKTPTWNTFEDQVQFVGGRKLGAISGIIDTIAPNWLKGANILRPNFSDFNKEPDELKKVLGWMKKNGFYLFNINAFGPGTPPTNSFGQHRVEKWKSGLMEDMLGDRYLGYDLGEQDGRYWADCRSIDYPMTFDYKERYIRAMKYMQRAAYEQGDIISMLSVKWLWHYPIKDGYITCSGVECQNKVHTSNSQVQYAFIRGASKQYGLLWYGDISVFNSWGWKSYGTEKNERTGPTKGNSVAWMKRMLLSQYQYNSIILGFEGSLYYGNPHEKELSPIGKLQTDMQNFVNKTSKPGPQYTPVAFLLDFFSGWMTPNEPFPDKYKVWGFLPYQKGDYFTHNLFKMFYPLYDECGLHKNEQGGLCVTPYGDAADVLLSDARISVLNRYAIIVVAGEMNTDISELSDKLNSYLEQGGHLIITDNNTQKLFPSLYRQSHSSHFKIDKKKIGKGYISIINCSNMGITTSNELDHRVKEYLDSVFKTTRIFSLTDSLGFITNTEQDNSYLLGVYNHALVSKPLEIKCNIGVIKKIEELIPFRDLTNEPGYFPEGYEKTLLGLSDEKHIAAGDVRLFRIEVEEKKHKIARLPKESLEKRKTNTLLSVKTLIGLSEQLQTMPTFFDHFSGIAVPWKTIPDIDSMKFSEDCWWYNLKQMQIAVLFDQAFINALKNNETILEQLSNTLMSSGYVTHLVFPKIFDAEIKKKIVSKFSQCEVSEFGNKNLIDIFDRPFNNWNDIYHHLKADIKKSAPNQKITTEQVTLFHGKVKPENRNYYFSHHDNSKDISDLLLENVEFISTFGGIKIDATYLYSRSMEKCIHEMEKIGEIGMDILVDFTREFNNYPDMTWMSELTHSYKRSVEIYKQIFLKMKAMHIDKAIIGSHMRPEMWRKDFERSPEESIIDGISVFLEQATKVDINVYLQNGSHIHYPSKLIATPNDVVNIFNKLSTKYHNLKLAAHFGLSDPASLLIETFNPQLDICIFASRGSEDRDYQIAFGKGQHGSFTVGTEMMIVFDADYASIDELIKDKKIVEKNNCCN